MTVTKNILSGATSGKNILVASITGSAATTIHTVAAGTMDEVWLWANNAGTTNKSASLNMGGTTVADQLWFNVSAQDGLLLICPGLLMTGSLTIGAFCETANAITITGFVNSITS